MRNVSYWKNNLSSFPNTQQEQSSLFHVSFFRRYFITDQALREHFRTKVHKRRLKALELEPYTIEESERAAGKGSYELPKKRKIETQTPADETMQKDEDGDVKMN
jgi:hypothetical protein